MIAEEKIAEIRQAARISEFVSPFITLKRKGRSLMGLCPFHNEKTPSFSVNDDNGFFHCFGCGAGGNVFKFLMQMENLTFPEAVRKVAERYGISVPEEDGGDANARRSLYEINASAAHYFQRYLEEGPAGEQARAYLDERGVSTDARQRFAVGCSPVSGQGLVKWFEREGIDLRAAQQLGLVGSRDGRTYDRFRGRLMFPIRDAQGRVIGFGGRQLGEGDGPKYLNSPESEIYQKSHALYGVYEAREALRATDSLILVEGYLDVIALHQHGVGNVVATCGTALTSRQARIMRRYAGEVVAIFDGDRAGSAAAARSFPVFVEAGVWPRGASLPEGDDPDSFVRTRGADALRGEIAKAVPLAEAYVRHVVDGSASGSAGMAKAGAEIATLLAKVEDPFEYDLLVRKAALWTGITESVLRTHSRRRATGSGAASAASAPSAGGVRRKGGAAGPEELLVTLMLIDPGHVSRIDASGVMTLMEEGLWRRLADDMINDFRSGRRSDTSDMIERLPEEYRSRVAGRLVEDTFGDERRRMQALEHCIRKIEENARRRHNLAMLGELRKVEELGIEQTPADQLAAWRPRNRSDA